MFVEPTNFDALPYNIPDAVEKPNEFPPQMMITKTIPKAISRPVASQILVGFQKY